MGQNKTALKEIESAVLRALPGQSLTHTLVGSPQFVDLSTGGSGYLSQPNNFVYTVNAPVGSLVFSGENLASITASASSTLSTA